jgi:hypothetical protein
MIAGFYKDTHVPVSAMRKAMGYTSCGGTDAPHGERGLQAYGIPASWGQLSSAEVIAKVNANIPVDLAVVYGRVPNSPAYKQDMRFTGLHSVLACKRIRNSAGVIGLAIRDPNRWGTGKVPWVFWPDSVWIPAWAAAKYVSVWPDKAKVIPVVPTVKYVMHVAANATVMMASIGSGGCISGWTSRKWGPTASSAPASAPVTRKGCSNGTATTSLITAGVFAGKHVRIGNGVTVTAV